MPESERDNFVHNYDFIKLNPEEFESLANDLLSHEFSCRVERFKPGKDMGIDGRFFTSGESCIIQSKHYASSGISKLISQMENIELGKIKKLNPARYILSTSLALSPGDKEKLLNILTPFVVSGDDILGKDDLNALLAKYPVVERSYFKLWIDSSAILSRFLHSGIYNYSEQVIATASDKNKDYVVTSSHIAARKILQTTGVLIITGNAGVGKTTLAEQLCLESVCEGFEFIAISEDIKEAYAVLDKQSPRVFLFDDFLGSNFLDAIRARQDSRIVKFIESVEKDKNKRLILTSRTNIIDRGYYLSQEFSSSKIKQKEYILNVNSYNDTDKAKILYSFAWKSEIWRDLCEEFISKKAYKDIIRHKNYNPRIIELIFNTDILKSEKISSDNYNDFINETLNNPSAAWRHPYETQLDELARLAIDLIVIFGGTVTQEELESSFLKLKKHYDLKPQNNLPSSFLSVVEPLCRSFIKRTISSNGSVSYRPFNPSISDFVIHKFLSAPAEYAEYVFTLDEFGPFSMLNSALSFNKTGVNTVSDLYIDKIENNDLLFQKTFLELSVISTIISDNKFIELYINKIDTIKNSFISEDHIFYTYAIQFFERIINLLNPNPDDIKEITIHLIKEVQDYPDLEKLSSFIKSYQINNDSQITDEFYESLLSVFQGEHLEQLIRDNIYDVTEEMWDGDEEYADCSYDVDEDTLSEIIAKTTATLVVSLDKYEVSSMLDEFELEDFAAESSAPLLYDDDRYGDSSSSINADDLFSTIILDKY